MQCKQTIFCILLAPLPLLKIWFYLNYLTGKATELANELDELCCTLEVNRLVDKHKQKKWLEHLMNCKISTGSSKLLAMVKSLSNPWLWSMMTLGWWKLSGFFEKFPVVGIYILISGEYFLRKIRIRKFGPKDNIDII